MIGRIIIDHRAPHTTTRHASVRTTRKKIFIFGRTPTTSICKMRISIFALSSLVLTGLNLNSASCFQTSSRWPPTETLPRQQSKLLPRKTSPLRQQDHPIRLPIHTKTTLQSESNPNQMFEALSSSRESDFKPGNCNFFYNDEVSSHLHGYMLLVALFAAKDPVRRDHTVSLDWWAFDKTSHAWVHISYLMYRYSWVRLSFWRRWQQQQQWPINYQPTPASQHWWRR